MKKVFLTAVAVVAMSLPSGASASSSNNERKIVDFYFQDCTEYAFDVMEAYAALGYSDHDITVAGNLAYAFCFYNQQ